MMLELEDEEQAGYLSVAKAKNRVEQIFESAMSSKPQRSLVGNWMLSANSPNQPGFETRKKVKLFDLDAKLSYQKTIERIDKEMERLFLRHNQRVSRRAQSRVRARRAASLRDYQNSVDYQASLESVASEDLLGQQVLNSKHHEDKLKWYDTIIKSSQKQQEEVFRSLPDYRDKALARDALKPRFTEHENQLFENAMRQNGNLDEILAELFKVQLSRRKIQCLDSGHWLNDEVINLYLKLLRQHSVSAFDSANQCYFHSTFFFTKLCENGTYHYRNVARWTKRGANKCDLFSQKLVFVPINVNNTHWALVVCEMKRRKVCYYDSMGGAGTVYLNHIIHYLEDEMRDKKQQELDTSAWEL